MESRKMKIYFFCFVSFFYSNHICNSHGIFKSYIKLLYENKKVKTLTESASTESLLQCSQLCGRKDNCVGVNFHQKLKQCELFRGDEFVENDVVPATHWSVHVLKKNVCDSNPCKNGGTCIPANEDDFKCICTDKYGKTCERDTEYELDITSSTGYVEVPVNFGNTSAFTFCAVFTEPANWDHWSPVMCYHVANSTTCGEIAVELTGKKLFIEIFSNRHEIVYHPKTGPQSVCVSWKNDNGRIDIYYNGVFQVNGYGNFGGFLVSPGTLSFGIRHSIGPGGCVPELNGNKYRGKVIFFHLHNRAFSDKEMKTYGTHYLVDQKSIVISWKNIRNETFFHGNVLIID